MIEKFTFNQDEIQLFYYKYKEILISLAVILVCILLVGTFVLPQFQDLFTIKDEETRYIQRIETLKGNISFLTALQNDTLDDQVRTSTSALPSEKDYLGILQSISNSAALSGASVGDFSFQVGELSTRSATLTPHPSLEVIINLDGDISTTKAFLKQMSQQFPLSDIESIDIIGRKSTIKVIFFYKNYPTNQVEDTIAFQPLPGISKQTLATLQEWHIAAVNARPIPRLIPATIANEPASGSSVLTP